MHERLRIAERTLALFAKHNHTNGHTTQDDHDMLFQLQEFTDCLDDTYEPDINTIPVLNQYTIPYQRQVDIPLDPAHIELIHTYLDDWVCDYHETDRTD